MLIKREILSPWYRYQLELIEIIIANPGITQKALALDTNRSIWHVSRTGSAMQQSGLILIEYDQKRTSTHKHFYVTDLGKEFLSEFSPAEQ